MTCSRLAEAAWQILRILEGDGPGNSGAFGEELGCGRGRGRPGSLEVLDARDDFCGCVAGLQRLRMGRRVNGNDLEAVLVECHAKQIAGREGEAARMAAK